MPMYVTPEKYRTMGFGMDIDDLDDIELATTLSRASAISETYCAVPRYPRQYSFLGGEITPEFPEQHPWRLPENDFDAGSRRVYPYSWPIKEVTDFKVKVTNTQYVSIAPAELFVNNNERYVEVISLQFTGVGLFGAIMPSIGLMRPVAQICYTYGFQFEMVDEIAFPTDARTYRGQNQYWLDDGPTVKVDGIVQDTGFTIDLIEGSVQFDHNLPAGSRVQLSYRYTLPTEVRDAVGEVCSYLLGRRESRRRGMADVNAVKISELSITKRAARSSGPSDSTIAAQLAALVPEAAILLDSLKNATIR